jgi:hypothetical protein
MSFLLGFLIKKYPKVTSVKKKPPYQYGHVILAMSCMIGQSNWILLFWLAEWLTKWLTIWLIDSGPFD